MRHDDLRGIPWTMLQPASPEEASILRGKQPIEQSERAGASKRATLHRIMPSEVRDPVRDQGECGCLTFFARVVIWGSRNSRAE